MNRYALILTVVCLLAVICLGAGSFAQPNLERATRETDRAMRDATKSGVTSAIQRTKPKKVSISIDTNAVSKPSADDKQKFFVREIEFIGMRSFTPYDLSYITRKYVNRELTSKDLNAFTKEIEMEYLKRGMVGVVFVPSQDIEDEMLKVQIIEKNGE